MGELMRLSYRETEAVTETDERKSVFKLEQDRHVQSECGVRTWQVADRAKDK